MNPRHPAPKAGALPGCAIPRENTIHPGGNAPHTGGEWYGPVADSVNRGRPAAHRHRKTMKGAAAPFRTGVDAVASSPCNMARPERFELPTTKFVAWYSIQLSYGRVEAELWPVASHPSTPERSLAAQSVAAGAPRKLRRAMRHAQRKGDDRQHVVQALQGWRRERDSNPR